MKTDILYHAWSNNCRGIAYNQLYIGHAYKSGRTTLCGVRFQEVGEELEGLEYIGCKKCRKIADKLPS